jgi:hypothetical protein
VKIYLRGHRSFQTKYNEVGEIQEGGLGPELSGFGRTLINIIIIFSTTLSNLIGFNTFGILNKLVGEDLK